MTVARYIARVAQLKISGSRSSRSVGFLPHNVGGVVEKNATRCIPYVTGDLTAVGPGPCYIAPISGRTHICEWVCICIYTRWTYIHTSRQNNIFAKHPCNTPSWPVSRSNSRACTGLRAHLTSPALETKELPIESAGFRFGSL